MAICIDYVALTDLNESAKEVIGAACLGVKSDDRIEIENFTSNQYSFHKSVFEKAYLKINEYMAPLKFNVPAVFSEVYQVEKVFQPQNFYEIKKGDFECSKEDLLDVTKSQKVSNYTEQKIQKLTLDIPNKGLHSKMNVSLGYLYEDPTVDFLDEWKKHEIDLSIYVTPTGYGIDVALM